MWAIASASGKVQVNELVGAGPLRYLKSPQIYGSSDYSVADAVSERISLTRTVFSSDLQVIFEPGSTTLRSTTGKCSGRRCFLRLVLSGPLAMRTKTQILLLTVLGNVLIAGIFLVLSEYRTNKQQRDNLAASAGFIRLGHHGK